METLIFLEKLKLLNKPGLFLFLKQVCLKKSNLRVKALKLRTLLVRVDAMANQNLVGTILLGMRAYLNFDVVLEVLLP